MASTSPIRVAILWHMHQPHYGEPGTNRLAMPWVRFHALKDYLDMPLLAARYEHVKVTFNLVPSLLDQIQQYVDGGTDRHLELSYLKPEDMTSEQKQEMLRSFFAANPDHMIEPYPRYKSLHTKARDASHGTQHFDRLFSSTELRDLQVWSNLVWVDPMFRSESPVAKLMAKEKNFSEDEKIELLSWQIGLLKRIVPTYRSLLAEDKIDISFTPYYHPILPLLCDTEVAREALQTLSFPRDRFHHPEDARRQIELSAQKYEELFGRPMKGMWPSEGAVSEESLQIAAELGIEWMATDQEILSHSLAKSSLDPAENHIHTVYKSGSGIRLLFRDHDLSDRVGFVYSGWPANRSVDDFVDHIKRLRAERLHDIENSVVSVILDGENAWEYFPGDGHEFLSSLYERLEQDKEIETVTMSEAARIVKPRPLPKLFAGSWINHNFRVWIGHQEDNSAWDLLSETRRVLAAFERRHPKYDPERLAEAWKQIYVAEGSDWCWWYGDEHRGEYNDEFDRLYRRHLAAVYELLGLQVPAVLQRPINSESVPATGIQPTTMLSPQIDGFQSSFYEWAGSGYLDCANAGGSMHRVDHVLAKILYAYDHDRFYIRLDFVNRKPLNWLAEHEIRVELSTPESVTIEISDLSTESRPEKAMTYQYAVNELVELGIERSALWRSGFGSLELRVSLFEAGRLLERWPDQRPLVIEVPEKNKEMFWPT